MGQNKMIDEDRGRKHATHLPRVDTRAAAFAAPSSVLASGLVGVGIDAVDDEVLGAGLLVLVLGDVTVALVFHPLWPYPCLI